MYDNSDHARSVQAAEKVTGRAYCFSCAMWKKAEGFVLVKRGNRRLKKCPSCIAAEKARKK